MAMLIALNQAVLDVVRFSIITVKCAEDRVHKQDMDDDTNK